MHLTRCQKTQASECQINARKWRATDTGPRFYKFNRSVFYKREDIEAWISEHYRLVEPKN